MAGADLDPGLTAAIVWFTRRWVPTAGGSGIPQVMAALDPALPPARRHAFTSIRISLAKIGLSSAGLLAGLCLLYTSPSPRD